MAKKETKKKLKDKDDSIGIPVRGCAEKTDMGIADEVEVCRSDKPVSSRQVHRKRISETEIEISLDNKLDFGFSLGHAPHRNPDIDIEARLKKIKARYETSKKNNNKIQ